MLMEFSASTGTIFGAERDTVLLVIAIKTARTQCYQGLVEPRLEVLWTILMLMSPTWGILIASHHGDLTRTTSTTRVKRQILNRARTENVVPMPSSKVSERTA